MGYSPLIGAAQQPQQIGRNSTWLWVSPIPASPLSLVHLHQSEKQMRKMKITVKKNQKGQGQINSCTSCDGIKLTSSLVWTVSPLANVTWTHGMVSAAWWGMGHAYFTTLDLYLTCTLSDGQQGHKTGDYKGGRKKKSKKKKRS